MYSTVVNSDFYCICAFRAMAILFCDYSLQIMRCAIFGKQVLRIDTVRLYGLSPRVTSVVAIAWRSIGHTILSFSRKSENAISIVNWLPWKILVCTRVLNINIFVYWHKVIDQVFKSRTVNIYLPKISTCVCYRK